MFKVVSDNYDRNFDRNSPRTGGLVRSKVGDGPLHDFYVYNTLKQPTKSMHTYYDT